MIKGIGKEWTYGKGKRGEKKVRKRGKGDWKGRMGKEWT